MKKSLKKALSLLGEDLAEIKSLLKERREPKTATDIEVHFDEVEKLPEKWCVKANNEEEAELLAEWVKNNKQTGSTYKKYELQSNYFHYPNHGGIHTASGIIKGYTEISFETFKRLVLKEDEKPVELEVGKWYNCKDDAWTCLWCPTHIEERFIVGYGFRNQEWVNETNLYDGKHNVEWAKENLTPATDEEVKIALIAEAERRGFKEGVKVNFYGVRSEVIRGYFKYLPNWLPNEAALIFGNDVIFRPKKGWAEIISEPEIDFSKAGQLVERGGFVAVTSGLHTEKTFTGCLIPAKYKNIDYSQRYFTKEGFILCTEPVTLSNAP